MIKVGGRRGRLRMWAMALALGTCVPLVAHAQSRMVSGIVVDRTGTPVAGARVAMGEPAAAGEVTASVSDLHGRFVLVPRIDRGTVVIDKPGFAPRRVTLPAADLPLRVVLDVAPIAEAIHVSAPLVDAAASDAFASTVTIVSGTQIEQLNAIDLASALRRTPGVTISRFNPVGSFGGEAGGAVFVRGTGASRPGSEIKTYVDGVPVYMGIWGHPLLDLLPVAAIDRVQVHKGPQPQTFGNAFSAIDLATRTAAGTGLDGTVRVSGGAFRTLVEQAEMAGVFGRWDLAVAQGIARSDGHREAADGRLANVFGRLGYRWGPRWSAAGTVLVSDNEASDPGVDGQPATRTGRFGTSGMLLALTLGHAHTQMQGSVQVYTSRGEGDWRGQPAPDGDTRTRFALTGLRWREQGAWRGAVVSGGVDVDRIDGSVQFDRVAPAPRTRFEGDALTLTAPHLAVERVFDAGRGWTLQPSAGLRAYAHSEFDAALAPHAGLVARSPGGLAVRARYARGLSYPGQEVVALSSLIPPLRDTWRTLSPESMQHVELGASLAPAPGTTVDAAWFRDRVTDRYVFAFPPAVAAPTFLNLGAYTVRGLEASLRQRVVPGWQTLLGVTLLDASEPALPYAPARSVTAGVAGRVGPIGIAVDLQHQSSMVVLARSRTAGATNLSTVDGFTVVNIRPSWGLPAWNRRVEIFAAIENLFDESYAYRPGYPMPGASAQVGVTIRAAAR